MEDKEILEISAKIERDFERSLSEHKPFCEEINKMMADNDWNIKIVECSRHRIMPKTDVIKCLT